MQFKDCKFDEKGFFTSPIFRSEPEPAWVDARKSGVLPESVFEFYQLAQYLSFDSAPPYLSDSDRILFTYFGIVLVSVLDSLVEAEDHRHQFEKAESCLFDPGKKDRGESWDLKALEQEKRAFKYFLLSELAALDAVAEMTAILFTGLVPKLQVGKAQFVIIERWLKPPLPPATLILTPQQTFLKDLYDDLRPHLYPDSPERDWLRLMRLYRNKAAHLGISVFRQVGLQDDSGKFYRFFPRQWPFIWEQYYRPRGQTYTGPTFQEFFQEALIHQDVISYVAGLRNKVNQVVGTAFSVFKTAYKHLRDLPVNQDALTQLIKSSEKYNFEQFS